MEIMEVLNTALLINITTIGFILVAAIVVSKSSGISKKYFLLGLLVMLINSLAAIPFAVYGLQLFDSKTGLFVVSNITGAFFGIGVLICAYAFKVK
jgi:ABC-type methionine transport system permease subunit